MSDESSPGWLPPGRQPGPPSFSPAPFVPAATTPPPPPPPPPASSAGPDSDENDSSGSDGGGRSRTVLIGGVIAVLAIGAAGVFAVSQMSADNEGGAASPEELGDAVMESIDQEDFLGVIDLLLPGERETFAEPLSEMVDELQRLEVLSDGASLEGIDGFDVTLDSRSVEVATTNVDDIANITMTADATVTVNGDELPVGELLTDNFGDAFGEMEGVEETDSGLEFSLPLTAVERDGRWYISAMYAAAETARQRAGFDEIPAEGVVPHGGDSPEGAVEVLLDGVEQRDLSAIIGGINPNEAEALQRYAPLFLGDAQDCARRDPGDDGVHRHGVRGERRRQHPVGDPHGRAPRRRGSRPERRVGGDGVVHRRLCRRLLSGRDAGRVDRHVCRRREGDLSDVEDALGEFGCGEAFDELRALWRTSWPTTSSPASR